MHSLASFVVTVCICSDSRAALFKNVEEIELFVVWLFYYSASTAIGSSLSVPALASDPSADICRHFIHPDGALLLLLVRSVVRTLLGRAAEKADDKRIAPDEIISPFQPGRDKRL